MKVDRGLRSVLLVALAIVGTAALLGTFPTRPWGQVSGSRLQSSPHDLSPQLNAFQNYSKDFREMLKASHGEEFEVVDLLDHVATTAEDRLDATAAMLQMYDNISSKSHRARVKPILKKQLAMYSWLFDQETSRTAGALTFVKAPAAAQMGLRMKDDLRAAKEKLDAIAASLE